MPGERAKHRVEWGHTLRVSLFLVVVIGRWSRLPLLYRSTRRGVVFPRLIPSDPDCE
jgi:hypothetical protein